jgi:hypothetical protein
VLLRPPLSLNVLLMVPSPSSLVLRLANLPNFLTFTASAGMKRTFGAKRTDLRNRGLA